METLKLIVFTRYPTPGKVKTRLIPALGAAGAAEWHRRMTERTVALARRFAARAGVQVAVFFDGGSVRRMKTWLARPSAFHPPPSASGIGHFALSHLAFSPQRGPDLGARMEHAFRQAFRQGCTRVVIVGTDCPGLNAAILTQAFRALQRRPAVLGPALDGGYYLIGLSRTIPELFRGIPWGTRRVYAKTARILRSLDLPFAVLPRLADVDRPADLRVRG